MDTYVRPNFPLVPETINLSPFDQFIGRHYSPVLLIFETAPDSSFEIIISELRQGLAKLLNDMPFLASNVVVSDPSRDYLELEIPEDAAVLFRVREMTEPGEGPVLNFAELQRTWFPTSVLESSHLSPISLDPAAVAPCLSVQATFIQGGLILAAYLHHSVVDGDGAGVLFNRWAKYVKAISEGRILSNSDPFDENALDRSPLFPIHPPRNKLYDFPGFQNGDESEEGGRWWSAGQRMAMYEREQGEKTKVAHWYFTKEKLMELQEMAKPKNPKDGIMTEGTILTAFIWKHFTIARRLKEQGISKVSCHNPCSIRARLEPQLHSDYLGNAVVPSKAELPITELLSSDPDTLYRVAAALRLSIDWWTSDRIWGLLGAMEAWPRVRHIERIMDLNYKVDLHITNVSGLSLMKLHWGNNLGPVRSFSMPSMSMMPGFGMVMPRDPDGGLLVMLFTEQDSHERLILDQDFLKFAEFKCS